MNGNYKKKIEKSKSHYVQNSSVKLYSGTKYWYFYCNRSGAHRFRGKGKRIIKSQGSCKIGSTCIAHMKVMEDTTTGHIIVEYCSTHNNHLTELAHLPIPVDVKHVIASKLNDGVGIEKILDDVREKLTTQLDVNNYFHDKTYKT